MSPRSEESRTATRASGGHGGIGAAVSRRGVILGVVVGVPVSVWLLGLSARHLDAAAFRGAMRNAHPAPVLLAVCAMAFVYTAQALRWRLVAGAESTSRRTFLRWVVGAVAVNNVVPGRVGDVLRIEWLSRGARIARPRAAASVAVDRGFDVVALGFALALTYPAMNHASWLDRVTLSAGALFLLVLALLAAAYFYSRHSRSGGSGRAQRAVADASRAAGEMVRGRRALEALLLSVVAWTAWTASAALVARSLGLHPSIAELLFATAVINLGVAIPSSPGFIGTYQWLAVSTLGLFGVAHAQAFAFSVLMHAVWFVPTTLAGAALGVEKLRPVVATAVLRPRAADATDAPAARAGASGR
jgi:glycosyltransferase 2 family protein